WLVGPQLAPAAAALHKGDFTLAQDALRDRLARLGGSADDRVSGAELQYALGAFALLGADFDPAAPRFRAAIPNYRALREEGREDRDVKRANALANLGPAYVQLGRLDEAYEAIRFATVLYREQLSTQRAAIGPRLASSLANLSELSRARGQREDALKALEQ